MIQERKKDVVIFREMTEEFGKELLYMIRTRGFHSVARVVVDEGEQGSVEDLSICKIYVVENTRKVRKLGLDLSQVYLVLDYQMDIYKYFDYQKCCFVEVRDKFSYNEKYRRVNLLSGSIG